MKIKQRYDIFSIVVHDTATWDGEVTREESMIGSIMAKSEAQAVAWFCWREGLYQFRVLDEWGDCCTTERIIAKLHEDIPKDGIQLTFL